jgi:hypothetical protein
MKFPLERLVLEGHLPAEYGNFTRRIVGRALLYTGEVEVPEVGARTLTIILHDRPSRVSPIVMADGPRTLRHRYRWSRPTSLCLWHPRDGAGLRWTLEDRLVGLIDVARVHLFREAWLRVHGRWPAPEVHLPPRSSERSRSRRLRDQRVRCWCGRRRYSRCHGAIDAADELRALGLQEG